MTVALHHKRAPSLSDCVRAYRAAEHHEFRYYAARHRGSVAIEPTLFIVARTTDRHGNERYTVACDRGGLLWSHYDTPADAVNHLRRTRANIYANGPRRLFGRWYFRLPFVQRMDLRHLTTSQQVLAVQRALKGLSPEVSR